ncbi:hypothetical protein HD806DRAFT_517081 [Xylariaceae sp. AK1471]|nr:hypothetical protein HD806DRAFT_517081 [Xylariaceae sp. AK1471]
MRHSSPGRPPTAIHLNHAYQTYLHETAMTNYYPSSTVIPIYSVFLGVGIFLTGLRIWVRRCISQQKLRLDDYLILFGLVMSAACTAIQYYNSLDGTGGAATSDADSKERAVILGHKIDFTMIVIEKFGFGAVKLSILFFYRRIFGVWASFRRVNNVLILIVALWALSFSLSDVLLCGAHPELNWSYNQTLALYRCGNRGVELLTFSVTSVATDIPILSLPFFYISRLQMSSQKKWAVFFVFGLGTISIGASIIRLIFLIVSFPVGRLNFTYAAPPDDQTPLVLQIFNPTFWALTELWLGLWAANLPPCGPLLHSFNIHPHRIIDSIRNTWQSRKSTNASDSARKRAFRRPPDPVRGDGRNPSLRGSARKMSSRDSAPLVTIGGHVRYPSQSYSWRPQHERVSTEQPPTLKPVEWTGGRLSVFDHLGSRGSSRTEL